MSSAVVADGHVVVCGLHGDGVRVVEQLRLAGIGVVVVDHSPDERLVQLLARLEVPCLTGDSSTPATLADAGLAQARAVICLAADDLHTLSTALLVRELRPEVRIVVALRNAAVGRALSSIGVAVLDIAQLSTPSVLEASLRTGVHDLELDGQAYVVAETLSRRRGSLRELYGDLAPVGVIRRGQGSVVVAPGRDHRVEPGDTVVVVGRAGEIEAAGVLASDEPGEPRFIGARAPREPRHRPVTWLRFTLATMDRRLKIVLSALAGLIVVSVVVLTHGYRTEAGERMSVLDAVYFTIETIGTVGFGDFYFRDQESWLRVWAIGLMVVGATMATVFFALLTNVLISRTLAQSLGRRKVTGLVGHVVVVGLGAVGLAVVQGLRAAEVETVVIEADEENRFLPAVRQQNTPVIIADATLPETFGLVGLDRARAVAVLTSDDLANIETGLAVRDLLGDRWSEVPVVLRVFDRRLASTVGVSFDFRYVRSTSALAAPWFVGAALGLDVLSTFYVGDQPMMVAGLPVPAGSVLDGVAMRDLGAKLRVVCLRRADGRHEQPRRDTRFGGGDTAYVIGPYEELIAVLVRP